MADRSWDLRSHRVQEAPAEHSGESRLHGPYRDSRSARSPKHACRRSSRARVAVRPSAKVSRSGPPYATRTTRARPAPESGVRTCGRDRPRDRLHEHSDPERLQYPKVLDRITLLDGDVTDEGSHRSQRVNQPGPPVRIVNIG
jgi:hypothetical protein